MSARGGAEGESQADSPVLLSALAQASAPSRFRQAAPERWGLGFGFLQTPRRQGNRGVSGNRAGSAEVRAAAGWGVGVGGGRERVQCRGQWPSGSSNGSWGKPALEKPHLNAPAPSHPPMVFTKKGMWGV